MRKGLTFALLCVSMACGEGTTEPGPGRGIQFVSGANLADTIDAILPQALVIEVRDSAGNLAPLATGVRFEAVREPTRFAFEAFVRALGGSDFSLAALGTTDASGRVSVQVRLGPRAGPARVAIYVPTLGLRDTARYTIMPGAVSDLLLEPYDTVLTVARSFSYRAKVTDRYGNVRGDPVSWQVSGPGVSVASTGPVTATAIGRFTITARIGAIAPTALLSVVPAGRMASVRRDSVQRIVVSDLDGSSPQDMGPISLSVLAPASVWLPGTNRMIISTANPWELRTVNDAGVQQRFLTTIPATLTSHGEPGPSANGQWVYFSGADTRCHTELWCLFRARSDGSGAELLSDTIRTAWSHLRPAPSPDGSRVAYVGADAAGLPVIKFLDVATRTVTTTGVRGTNPRWSPDGTQIAVFDPYSYEIKLIPAITVGTRTLPGTFLTYEDVPMSWSADGKFLLVKTEFHFSVVEISTGLTIPLSQSDGWLAAIFRW